jgi:hypothetical protein
MLPILPERGGFPALSLDPAEPTLRRLRYRLRLGWCDVGAVADFAADRQQIIIQRLASEGLSCPLHTHRAGLIPNARKLQLSAPRHGPMP